jgi:flagellar hook-basal body complex protein FliE
MNSIAPIIPSGTEPEKPASAVTRAESGFSEMLQDSLSKVNDLQQSADAAAEALHSGGAKNLHEVMIAMEQSDISLRYMVNVRNKLLEAYQEIMRLQV